MAITINGNGTISGISSGGINDDVVDAGTIAANSRMILEQFYSPCDGSTIATSNGNITLTNVTAAQDLTSTHADISGSSISYNPPTGTTQVIYEYQFYQSQGDTSNLGHYKFNVDGTDVTNSRFSHYLASSSKDAGLIQFKWAVNIGGSTTAATGRLASWSGAKTLKLMGREYSGDYEVKLNNVYYWDGVGTNILHQPCIGITAIG